MAVSSTAMMSIFWVLAYISQLRRSRIRHFSIDCACRRLEPDHALQEKPQPVGSANGRISEACLGGGQLERDMIFIFH